jgi:pyruvate kinase
MMLKQTKIVASISDERCEVEFIRDLFDAGMNVVRMNTAHASREGFEKLINNVREVSNRIAILMDTKGPEVRTTPLQGGEPIPFKIGDRVKVVGNPALETTREQIAVSYPGFVNDLSVGGDILIDDGDLELKVIEKTDDYLLCEAQNEATLGNRKSVNVPGVRINLPSLTEKDRNNILYAIEKDIDYIAHSFVRNKQDVLDIRQILDQYGSDIRIIAKIENQEGVDNIDEILEVADGVMVARGDLGIEVPQERIPGIQRLLIKKCILAKKPVIVATQMLHTMIKNPRPTRAEVTDIANAIYYRTDALMLSGETAYGKYPVEAVKTMAKIAAQAEKDKLAENDIRIPLIDGSNDVTAFLAKQAVKATSKLNIRAIITDSFSGPRQVPRAGHLLQGEDHASPGPVIRRGGYLPAREGQRPGLLLCRPAQVDGRRRAERDRHGGLPQQRQARHPHLVPRNQHRGRCAQVRHGLCVAQPQPLFIMYKR